VAAVQAQQREIDELRPEVAQLRELLGAAGGGPPGDTPALAKRKPGATLSK
jgi:hypothetical protein